MALLKDKNTNQFWKAHGMGLTSNADEAHDYTVGQAQALSRLYHEDTFFVAPSNTDQNVLLEYAHTPDPRQSPRRTQAMKDRGYVWLSYEGVWLVGHVQDLAMTTMLTLHGESPAEPFSAPPRAA